MKELLDIETSKKILSPREMDLFLKKHGWSESCLYDDMYNPPSALFFKLVDAGGAYVYSLEDAYCIECEQSVK